MDVFVSYKKEDLKSAERVVEALKASGLSVWWDDGLTPKTAWDSEIERRIAESASVLVLWTPRSIASEWVRTEAHYGQDRGKLVPVMLEQCAIPLAFMLRQTINLCDWNGDTAHRQWRKLLAWVGDLIATKPGNANIPQALVAAQPNAFREIVGSLKSGEPVFDGELVNASTPAGTAFRDGSELPVMRILAQGTFLLGSPTHEPGRSVAEGPQKRIELPAPFALGVYPVLVSEFEAVLGRLPKVTQPLTRAAPVTHITFDEAQELVARISARSGESYRVPSEAEWEYACRAGTRGSYSFGDRIDTTMALFDAAEGPKAAGLFPANAFGLHDMHGNTREWTADLWHESYESTPSDGRPAGEGHSSMRVVRGGGWCDKALMLRSANRMRATETVRSNVIGVRVARALA